MLSVDTQVLVDAEAVAQQACAEIAAAAQAAIRERGVFRLVMAGGGTPQRAYTLLAATAQDWDKWEIFWGDERCLPVDHLERNSQMSLPTPHRFPIPAELGAEAAAAAYAQTIHDKLPFDMVMLGMGEDGHTASLFPAAPGLDEALASPGPAAWVRPATAPHARLTLTLPVLLMARHVYLPLSGEAKLKVYREAQKAADPALPISLLLNSPACDVQVWTS